MDTQENDLSFSWVTHQAKTAQIRLAIEPSLRQVKKLSTLLAERYKLHTTGINKATSSQHDDTTASSSGNRYAKQPGSIGQSVNDSRLELKFLKRRVLIWIFTHVSFKKFSFCNQVLSDRLVQNWLSAFSSKKRILLGLRFSARLPTCPITSPACISKPSYHWKQFLPTYFDTTS